ncbi:YtxH domain-containing protein [Chryseomicrobium aureum]|uniref:YtxH domain-containing protein n=1 Tax=Chryseomicrobium aureum TaxID=1441723 RepID=UPI0019573A1B|nr:YtxH domain-containing protein [Chryseomicrobium aureum]MBM7707405.1 gas vesicle protein [Chryseomicrobium aureum]
MGQSKFSKGILFGALAGAAISLLDRQTREVMKTRARSAQERARYYSENREILKHDIEMKINHYKSLYEKLSQDAQYLSSQVNEVKQIAPQVQTLFSETKDTFSSSKEEYKEMISEASNEAIQEQEASHDPHMQQQTPEYAEKYGENEKKNG